MRILVVGDAYCPAEYLAPALKSLGPEIRVRRIDVTDRPGWAATTPSERCIREYTGTPDQVIAALHDGDEILVVQGAPVTDAVLDAGRSLRLVCCARGGPVNVDVAAASARGIPIVTTPGKNADAVADLTISFLLMLARRLPEAMRSAADGRSIYHDNYEGGRWFGHDLAGQRLGLIGYGLIGRRVAGRANAFGMTVAAADPFVDPAVLADDGVVALELDPLLRSSDFVSVHARLTPENAGLLGRREFDEMRQGAYLINTARTELVDEAALQAALTSGHLAGAALDVASPSPGTAPHPLLAYPNVIMTPHVGGATYETLRRGGEMAAAEIDRFLRGRPLVNVANRAELERLQRDAS
jgi:D-3-phosphoglycerate dehydrogenase